MGKNRPEPPLREKIKELMDARGLKSAELSKQTKLPQTTIRYILQGITDNPRIDTVMQLADFFEVTVNYLLGEEDVGTNGANNVLKPVPVINIERQKDGKGMIKVPLLEWSEVKYWCTKGESALNKNHNKWVAVDDSVSPYGYALHIIYEGRGVFPKNSVIVVDPHVDHGVNDFVVASINKNKPTIKQIWQDGDDLYMNPVGAMIPAVKIENPHLIYGTIVEYRLPMIGMEE